MSGIRYTSRGRRFPLHTQPPPILMMNPPRRGVRIYRTSRYPTGPTLYYNNPVNYPMNPYYYQQPRPVHNREQIIYDQYYRPVYDRPHRRVYQRQPSLIRSRSCSSRRQRRLQQQQQAHIGRPRSRRLNDFMPTEFRNVSPSLPATFNLANTVTTPSATTLPIVADSTTVNTGNPSANPSPQTVVSPNTTQPFVVNQQETVTPQQQLPLLQQRRQQRQQPQGQSMSTRPTMSFSRRLQRRNLSPTNRTIRTSNRFATLSEENDEVEVVSIVDEDADESLSIMNNDSTNQKKTKKNSNKCPKVPTYLEYNRLMTWLRNNGKAKDIESSSGNHAFVVHSLPIYDRRIRDHYELQVWQQYLELGTNQQYWPKEIVQRTKIQDNIANRKFVTKKINQLSARLAQTNITLVNLRNRLGIYWTQVPRLVTPSESSTQVDTATEVAATTTTGSSISKTVRVQSTPTYTNLGPDRIRKKIMENETIVLDYLYESTKHIRKRAELRIELAKAQWNEYKAFVDFENVATPTHFTTHEIIKSKMRIWSNKNKKRQTLNRRMEFSMPPKFITRVNFNFQLDESICSRQEVQEFYNEMSTMTQRYRTEALRIYQEAALREYEVVSIEIQQLLDSLQQSTPDDKVSATAFREYHRLREKRLNLEAEQSAQFLFEQRAEGELDDSFKSMETFIPTSAQVLRDDFLLQSKQN